MLAADGVVEPATIAKMHAEFSVIPPVKFSETPAKSDITPGAKSGGIIAALVAVLAKLFGRG